MAKATPRREDIGIGFWLRQAPTRRLKRTEVTLREHVLTARHVDRAAWRRLLALRSELADRGVRLPELAE
jgi:hypothetical protein